jgi:two-component system, OmpR family, copper resistance phosphate regulon response regulator CusR
MKILLVEDDAIIAKNIKTVFARSLVGVDISETLEDGIFLAESETYDVIVLDWQLPDGEGISLITSLRKNAIDTPILMLTARSQLEDKVAGLNTGADDYVTKPFEMNELLARVKSLFRRNTAAKSSPILQVDDVMLDTNKCEVKVGRSIINLSHKEYSLLEYFMTHPCQVISRDDLLFHVWGEHSDLLSNTIDVHIRYLRQKIDEGRKKKLIKTIKNKGYMLCND